MVRLAAIALLAATASAATLTIERQRFLLDGRPFDMWGIRTASATQSAALADHLIAQLDEYKRYGVNTVSVYLMGSSGGYSDPFSPDGASIAPDHLARLVRILREADRRGIVVVSGIFYQRANPPSLRDWDAARRAVRTVTDALKPHRNVILNIANEQNSNNYAKLPWERVRNVDDVLDLCRIAKTADPARIVGAGGYDHDKNELIGKSPDVDALLFDTKDPILSSGVLYDRFVKAGIAKPMVNVETFGGWTRRFLPPGVFPEDGKAAYRSEVDDAARRDGLYLHFHNNPWCQGVDQGLTNRYDLGGEGTPASPGIRWYFEYVKGKLAR